MVNFKKLKKLISDYEKRDDLKDFFQSLKYIAEIELNLRQKTLLEV